MDEQDDDLRAAEGVFGAPLWLSVLVWVALWAYKMWIGAW